MNPAGDGPSRRPPGPAPPPAAAAADGIAKSPTDPPDLRVWMADDRTPSRAAAPGSAAGDAGNVPGSGFTSARPTAGPVGGGVASMDSTAGPGSGVGEGERARAYGFALRLTGDRHRAEDIAQETIMRLLRVGSVPRPAYLYRVVLNLVRSEARTAAVRRRSGADPASLPDPRAADPLGAMVSAETRDAVWHALGRMPEREREALLLRFGEGASCPDIAEALDTTPNGVSCLLHRAKERLRSLLAERSRP